MIIGNGWKIHHLTDREIELRKDDYTYRILTGRDGYVIIRAEPGMDRHIMVQKAISLAKKNDDVASLRMAKRLAPNMRDLANYTGKQVKLAKVFETPESEG